MPRTGRASTEEKERLRRERISAKMKEIARTKFRESTGRFESRVIVIRTDYRIESRRTPKTGHQLGWDYNHRVYRIRASTMDSEVLRRILDEREPSRSHYNITVEDEGESDDE